MTVPSAATAVRLELEFARAEQAGDPYAFRFAPQNYLLRRAGGGFESASLPWDAALLAELEAARRPGRDPEVLQCLGATLRRFLEPLGWAAQESRILEAVRQGRRVLITVRSAAAELYALPWELLTIKATGQHVGELAGVLLRYEWPETTTTPERPLPRPDGGRILLAWSAAGGAVPASEHLAALEHACRAGFHPFVSRHDVVPHASCGQLTAALAAALKEGRPISVLHLLCHGGKAGDTFGLLLDGEDSESEAVVINAGRLRLLLAPYADMLRLVVLMACDSGNVGALGNQLGSVAQTLHRAGIAAVVASRYPLSVEGSVRVAAALYTRLLIGPDSLEHSFVAAREELAKNATHEDWVSLQMYARAADGDDTRPLVFRPYQGLVSFGMEQSRFFFGRRALTEKLWLRCRELFAPSSASRLLAILGPSGSGKSSVARAGLLAELLQRPLPELQPLRVVSLKPGARPKLALQRALAEATAASPEQPLLLLVDQFEEVYTLCKDSQERDAFVAWLLQAAGDPARRVAIVLTLPSDFFGETQRHHAALNQLIAAQHELVAGLTDDELRQAIAEPAIRTGRALDPSTVDLLLAEARGSESALPLLQFALCRIWEGLLANRAPSETLHAVGGVGGALADQAKTVYGALSDSEQATARRALVRLVQPGEGTRDTRRRVPIRELCGRHEAEEDVLAVLRKFAAETSRMVTLSSRGTETVAEVTHEALFDHWMQLRTWIDESRTDRRFQDRVAEAARLWNEDRSRLGRLWRPPDLDLLRAYAARKPEDLSTLEEEFFAAAQKAQEAELAEKQQRARLLRTGLVLVSSLLIVVTVIAVYAFVQRDQAEQRELDMVVEDGRQFLVEKTRPIDALLRLQQANERGSRSPLLPYLLADAARPLDAVRLVLRQHLGYVASASYSPDGGLIVTGSEDQTARIWDAHTGQLVTTLHGHSGVVRAASYSPDGRHIVTGSADQTARIWDTHTGQLVTTLHGHSGVVHAASYSPDGRHIVTGSADRTARIWDSQTGQLVTTFQGGFESIYSASYSPDGRHIILGSGDNRARIWDAQTGKLVTTLRGHSGFIYATSYNPDGSRVVTGSGDQTAKIWDAHTGQLVATLQGHSGFVYGASFSPDGRRIATGSADQTTRVWDAQAGQLLTALQAHSGTIYAASYSPDGRHIVTSGEDHSALVWDVVPEIRSPAELRRLIRCRLVERLPVADSVPAGIGTEDCQSIAPPVPRPATWDKRNASLWRGIYALQAKYPASAKQSFVEARQQLEHFQDMEGLAKLTWAEAALSADDQATAPAAVIDLVNKVATAEQPRVWLELAQLAHRCLYRPSWAVWALGELHKMEPGTPDFVALVRASKQEFLLATGLAAEVLRQAPEVLAVQTQPASKAVVAALAWVAATRQSDSTDQHSWAKRTFDLYITIDDGAESGWIFDGIRHAYLDQPESPSRAAALELFAILEQTKSATTTKQLGTLLGVLLPQSQGQTR